MEEDDRITGMICDECGKEFEDGDIFIDDDTGDVIYMCFLCIDAYWEDYEHSANRGDFDLLG